MQHIHKLIQRWCLTCHILPRKPLPGPFVHVHQCYKTWVILLWGEESFLCGFHYLARVNCDPWPVRIHFLCLFRRLCCKFLALRRKYLSIRTNVMHCLKFLGFQSQHSTCGGCDNRVLKLVGLQMERCYTGCISLFAAPALKPMPLCLVVVVSMLMQPLPLPPSQNVWTLSYAHTVLYGPNIKIALHLAAIGAPVHQYRPTDTKAAA